MTMYGVKADVLYQNVLATSGAKAEEYVKAMVDEVLRDQKDKYFSMSVSFTPLWNGAEEDEPESLETEVEETDFSVGVCIEFLTEAENGADAKNKADAIFDDASGDFFGPDVMVYDETGAIVDYYEESIWTKHHTTKGEENNG